MKEMSSIYYQHNLNVTLCSEDSLPSYQRIDVLSETHCMLFLVLSLLASSNHREQSRFNGDYFMFLAPSCPG